MNFLCVSVFLLRPCHNTKPQREQSGIHSNTSWLLLILLQGNDSTQCKVAEQVRQYCITSLEGPQSVSYYPPHPLHPIETAKVGYCPKSWPVLFTIITLKSDSWFRSTGYFCGRLYRSGVLMSSSGAVANGVVSGVRSKRPRWDYHSQGGLRKVLPAQALRVQATHFRGQGKLSNEQPGLSLPCFKDYTVLYYNKALISIQTYVPQRHICLISERIQEGIRNSPPCCNLTLSLHYFV